MKTFKKALVIIILLVTLTVDGQNYFPANIGDTREWYSNIDDSSYSEILTNIIELNDGSKDIYYNEYDKPIFNLKSDGNVYQYFGENNLEIWYDFSIASQDTFFTNIYSSEYYVLVDSSEGELFGELTNIRIFNWVNIDYPSLQSTQWISEKFGKFRTKSFLGPIDSYLIGCRINNKDYGSLVNIKTEDSEIVNYFQLYQNYPNPFNPTTQISYQIPKNSFVSLVVYNSLGQEVAQLVNKYQSSGQYTVQFNATNLPSSVYIYKLQANNFNDVKKMLLTK